MEFETIKKLTVIHANSYSAQLNGGDILSFLDDDNKIAISFKNNYHFEEDGYLRWASLKPIDKDEITNLEIEFDNGRTESIRVPFKDESTNGAFVINEKSKVSEYDNYFTLEWEK